MGLEEKTFVFKIEGITSDSVRVRILWEVGSWSCEAYDYLLCFENQYSWGRSQTARKKGRW